MLTGVFMVETREHKLCLEGNSIGNEHPACSSNSVRKGFRPG